MRHRLSGRQRAARTTAAFAAVVVSAALGAGSTPAILPPMLLFATLDRYYVRGLFAGATKG